MEVTQAVQYMFNGEHEDNSLPVVDGRWTTVRLYLKPSLPPPLCN